MQPLVPTPSIRFAKTEADRLAVYRFRYRVYVEEMQRDLRIADHARGMVFDALDGPDAHVLGAWIGERVVATVRSNYLRDGAVGDYEELYRLHELAPARRRRASVTTRLMVAAEHRRGTITSSLCRAIYRRALADGIEVDYSDCDLRHVPFFEALGYRVERTDLVHPAYGPGALMRLDLLDAEHLDRVRSPFRRDLRSAGRTRRDSLTESRT